MTSEVLERLSELEHVQWSQWARTLMENENLSGQRMARWARLIATPYAMLTEAEKEQDREWAKKALKIMREGTSFDVPAPPSVDGMNKVGTETYLFRSSEDPSRWYIVMAQPVPWCSCPSFKFRSPTLCKHLIEIL